MQGWHMKVLTIKQEFIEMFLNGTKKEEIRSWKTYHRGEVLLHCSTKDASPDMAGCIVARCDLTQIKWNIEKNRFEWKLENVKPLPEKIKVKGKLGLWNFNHQ
jgi:hypothetical protein